MAAVDGTRADLRDRALGELVKGLSSDFSTLLRLELALARAELGEKGKQAGVGTGMFGGAAIAGLMMLGALTAFLIVVLAIALPAWAAALIVTLIWGAVAGLLALQGRARLARMGKPVPEQTLETVKEDVQWLKNRI